MEKKQYMAPRMQIYEMETASFIAESYQTKGEVGGTPRGKDTNAWDFEDENY
jgi:hypothetical protein